MLDLQIQCCGSVEAAVRDAAIVIGATDSLQPVIQAAWIAPGTHVTTIGPKSHGQHELDLGVADRAAIIATDSPAQIAAYDPPFFLQGTPHMDRMVSLAAIVAGKSGGRKSAEDITLFCSTGLAGTEVLLADRLLDASS
jgi:alanine dehydrogenase